MATGTGEDPSKGAICLATGANLLAGPAYVDGYEARATLATASRRRSSSDLGLRGRLHAVEM